MAAISCVPRASQSHHIELYRCLRFRLTQTCRERKPVPAFAAPGSWLCCTGRWCHWQQHVDGKECCAESLWQSQCLQQTRMMPECGRGPAQAPTTAPVWTSGPPAMPLSVPAIFLTALLSKQQGCIVLSGLCVKAYCCHDVQLICALSCRQDSCECVFLRLTSSNALTLFLPGPALTCSDLPCPALPCPALPCPVLSCSALLCLALPCSALP